MKKQILSSAILAALSVATAQAALPTIDPNTTTTLYISGASAQRAYIEQLMVGQSTLADTDRICDQTAEIWKFSDATGTNWNAYYCVKKSTNLGLASVKANVLVHKRSSGGSDMGVAPIIANSAVGFLDLTTCTVGTQAVAGSVIGTATCTGTANNQVADLGVSDVDPAQFVGKNVSAGYAAVSAADLANLTISSTSAVVFGEPVTISLYKALQAAQFAAGEIPATTVATVAGTVNGVAQSVGQTVNFTIGDTVNEAFMPSLSSELIASIHAGKVTNWNQIIVPGSATVAHPADYGLYDWVVAFQPSLAPAANKVHVVRRVNGSGTQTQHGINFLNYPCDIRANTAMNHGRETEATANSAVVHEESTAGNVKAALKGLENATVLPDVPAYAGKRWGVGLNSLENADASQEFVKVDGVAPTLANVNAGKYKDWVENTFQYNTAHVTALGADIQALLAAIEAKAAHPNVLSSLNATFVHGYGKGAYLAIPSSTNGYIPTANFVDTNPVNTYTRTPAGAATDNCRAPVVYSNTANFAL